MPRRKFRVEAVSQKQHFVVVEANSRIEARALAAKTKQSEWTDMDATPNFEIERVLLIQG